jgi:hypothetical protein
MLPFPVTFAPQPNHSPSATRVMRPNRARQLAQFQSLTNAAFANSCAFMQIQMPGGVGRRILLPKAGIAPVRRITEVRQAPDPLPRALHAPVGICYAYLLSCCGRPRIRRPVPSSVPGWHAGAGSTKTSGLCSKPGNYGCGLYLQPAQINVRALLGARVIK